MDKQLTEKEAVLIHAAEDWKGWSSERIVKLQLFQDRLCIPFGVFHEAIEKVLGRPVWTREFAFAERLREEYLKERPKPSFEEIIGLIPSDKLLVVAV